MSEAAEKPAEGEKVKSETVGKPEGEEDHSDGPETKEASAADGNIHFKLSEIYRL